MYALKCWLRKALSSFFRVFVSIICDEIDYYNENLLRIKNSRLLARLQSCGFAVRLNGKVYVSQARCCVIGNNVHIGDNAFFKTEGGLVIGDNTHISRNVVIYTVNHNYNGNAIPYDSDQIYKPVIIGKNVWIGMNVKIVPGVSIGEGAVIGLGSVVVSDVPDGAVVGGNPARLLKYRDLVCYKNNKALNNIGGRDGILVSDYEKIRFFVHARESRSNLFFILTTGRSGSTSIAASLSKHVDIDCRHEPRPQLVRLSTEYAHNLIDREDVIHELKAIYECASYKKPINGESDQKFFNLINELALILPEAKFIWLIRDAKDVVASAVERNWFADDEYNPEERDYWLKYWQKYRLNGYLCGEFSYDEWNSMSIFERNCWYWKYVNEIIEKGLESVDDNRKLRITLAEANDDLSKILRFVGAKNSDIKMGIYNEAKQGHSPKRIESWTDEEKNIYDRYCESGMQKWYL